MSKYFILLITLFPLMSLSQSKEIFIDENMVEIDSLTFNKKCSSRVLKCLKYQDSTLIVNKAHRVFKFGKVSSQEYNQIRLLLIKKSKLEISPDQIIVIKHVDSIGGSYQAYLKKREENSHNRPVFVTSNVSENNRPIKIRVPGTLSEKQYDMFQRRGIAKYAKCVKKFERKYNSRVITTYKFNGNKKDLYKSINWVDYPGIIIPKFLNSVKNGRYLIIKPDGEYFVASRKMGDSSLEKLFKDQNWTKHKEHLERSETENSKIGYGIFRPFIVIEGNLKFCF